MLIDRIVLVLMLKNELMRALPGYPANVFNPTTVWVFPKPAFQYR